MRSALICLWLLVCALGCAKLSKEPEPYTGEVLEKIMQPGQTYVYLKAHDGTIDGVRVHSLLTERVTDAWYVRVQFISRSRLTFTTMVRCTKAQYEATSVGDKWLIYPEK
jgi:hypothetical protein